MENSLRIVRSQSAIQAHREDVPTKHDNYLINLQERNKLLKLLRRQENGLKQREIGFQLYINGAHNPPTKRPSSIRGSNNQNHTSVNFDPLLPYFSDFKFPTKSTTNITNNNNNNNNEKCSTSSRRRWSNNTTVQIKTKQGSTLVDFPLNLHQSPAADCDRHAKSLYEKQQMKSEDGHLSNTPSAYSSKYEHNRSRKVWDEKPVEINATQLKANYDNVPFYNFEPVNVKESWLPNWCTKTIDTHQENDESNSNQIQDNCEADFDLSDCQISSDDDDDADAQDNCLLSRVCMYHLYCRKYNSSNKHHLFLVAISSDDLTERKNTVKNVLICNNINTQQQSVVNSKNSTMIEDLRDSFKTISSEQNEAMHKSQSTNEEAKSVTKDTMVGSNNILVEELLFESH
ncbi:unnamed protein product [Didymodactylos carnosus]|uniref:Uncharacterized protein n=1 Tax=Didymodactylos carnosus TaxID=1234261 RepID=A0A8S2EDZ9_9BILA|nr:unnamed protein product [Didymodactylos carnosus]CAF3927197.1 unnamed protein product [Didymodactylos carnosus]